MTTCCTQLISEFETRKQNGGVSVNKVAASPVSDDDLGLFDVAQQLTGNAYAQPSPVDQVPTLDADGNVVMKSKFNAFSWDDSPGKNSDDSLMGAIQDYDVAQEEDNGNSYDNSHSYSPDLDDDYYYDDSYRDYNNDGRRSGSRKHRSGRSGKSGRSGRSTKQHSRKGHRSRERDYLSSPSSYSDSFGSDSCSRKSDTSNSLAFDDLMGSESSDEELLEDHPVGKKKRSSLRRASLPDTMDGVQPLSDDEDEGSPLTGLFKDRDVHTGTAGSGKKGPGAKGPGAKSGKGPSVKGGSQEAGGASSSKGPKGPGAKGKGPAGPGAKGKDGVAAKGPPGPGAKGGKGPPGPGAKGGKGPSVPGKGPAVPGKGGAKGPGVPGKGPGVPGAKGGKGGRAVCLFIDNEF